MVEERQRGDSDCGRSGRESGLGVGETGRKEREWEWEREWERCGGGGGGGDLDRFFFLMCVEEREEGIEREEKVHVVVMCL